MAAVPAELPPLSEVESASFDHLTDAAAYYRRAADSTERAFTAVRDAARRPGGTEWAGQAQEADLAARERDLVIAGGAETTMNTQNDQTNTPKAQGTTPCFVLANPWADPENYSVPKLLRRVAGHIDELGDDVIVNDLILHIEVTSEGYLPSINVYYYYEKGE